MAEKGKISEPEAVLLRQSSPSQNQWLSRFAHLQNSGSLNRKQGPWVQYRQAQQILNVAEFSPSYLQ